MAVNPTKNVTVAGGETETVYFKNGYPRCGAMRGDVTAEGDGAILFDFGVGTDDDVADKTYADFDTVHQASVAPADGYTGAGTTAMGRSVAIQVQNDGTTSATVELELSNTSDPAQNDHGFAYANTYRESDRK